MPCHVVNERRLSRQASSHYIINSNGRLELISPAAQVISAQQATHQAFRQKSAQQEEDRIAVDGGQRQEIDQLMREAEERQAEEAARKKRATGEGAKEQ